MGIIVVLVWRLNEGAQESLRVIFTSTWMIPESFLDEDKASKHNPEIRVKSVLEIPPSAILGLEIVFFFLSQ